MASVHTLARPYARAAFEFAKSANTLAEWSQKLGFSAHITEVPEVKALIEVKERELQRGAKKRR